MFILKKPLVTDKMSLLKNKAIYGFIVKKEANKIEIKKVIENKYKVKIKKINTLIYYPKKKKKYINKKIFKGKTSYYKNVIVKLEKGNTIDFYKEIQ
jgi:large subunit ribosomal protein L23